MPFIYVLAVEQLNEGCLLHSFLLSWMMNEWYIVFHPASSPTPKDMHANAIVHAWQDTCVAGSGAYCTCTITLVVRRCASYSTAILWIHPCMHRRQCTSSPGKQYTPKLFWARDEDDACTQTQASNTFFQALHLATEVHGCSMLIWPPSHAWFWLIWHLRQEGLQKAFKKCFYKIKLQGSIYDDYLFPFSFKDH